MPSPPVFAHFDVARLDATGTLCGRLRLLRPTLERHFDRSASSLPSLPSSIGSAPAIVSVSDRARGSARLAAMTSSRPSCSTVPRNVSGIGLALLDDAGRLVVACCSSTRSIRRVAETISAAMAMISPRLIQRGGVCRIRSSSACFEQAARRCKLPTRRDPVADMVPIDRVAGQVDRQPRRHVGRL